MLFGRDAAIAGAVACIERRGIRFLTITGRLGVGRTAVATAVAARLAHDAVLVDVGGAAEQHEVVVRLARAVGVTGAGRRIGAALVGRLSDGPTAIVLDDADDWVAVAPVVDLLLGGCDELVVIATARTAPPATTPESVVHLHPLSVPAPYGSNEKALRETPAVQLFVDRAQRVDPAFDPTSDDLRTIGELCRRLDGLPLAVALAASRISLMQPDAMLREMRRVGSWELVGLSLDDEVARAIADLDGSAQRTLAALDVFVGGASIDALQAVTGLASLDETMTALADLVDRDLVAIDRERARYSLASATSAHLSGDGPGADTSLAQRHADYFSTHAREHIEGRDDPDLAIEHGNRLAAVSWLQGSGRHDQALRLLVDMAGDFDRRGEPDAGRPALAAALAGASGDDPRTEAEAHLWIARFVAESIAPADHRLAIEHQMLARAKAEASGHEPTLLAVLLAICESHTLLGSFDLAADTIAAGLARTGDGTHPVAEVGFLTWKAVVTHQSGDARQAAEIVAEAIAKAVALGDRRLIVRSCLVFLGLPSDVRADVVTESPSPRDLVEMARTDGDVRGAGWILALVTATRSTTATSCKPPPPTATFSPMHSSGPTLRWAVWVSRARSGSRYRPAARRWPPGSSARWTDTVLRSKPASPPIPTLRIGPRWRRSNSRSATATALCTISAGSPTGTSWSSTPTRSWRGSSTAAHQPPTVSPRSPTCSPRASWRCSPSWRGGRPTRRSRPDSGCGRRR